MTRLAVIPVRMTATRLPGKPLMRLDGRSIVQWVHDATVASGVFDDVRVATDSAEIADEVTRFGGHAELTSPACRTGTERVAEVAARVPADLVANVQGDQPFVTTQMLSALVRPFDDPAVDMTTIGCRFGPGQDLADPSLVKVLRDRQGRALYFSRAAVPYGAPAGSDLALHHIGLYAFRRAALLSVADLEPSPLELQEGLEQLRALEAGMRIGVEVVPEHVIEINTPDDYAQALALVGGTA